MKNIQDNDVNNIAEWNLIHDIINLSKRTKNDNYWKETEESAEQGVLYDLTVLGWWIDWISLKC